MTNILGHKTHAMNLQEFAPNYKGIDCFFSHVPADAHRWDRTPVVKDDPILQAGLDGRTELTRFVKHVDIAFMHTETTAFFSADLMKRIPTIVSLDATQKQWYEMNKPFFDDSQKPSLMQRLKMKVLQKTGLKHRLYTRVMKNAIHIVAWSEWNKQGICEEYGVKPEDVTVIAPGVNVSRFQPNTEEATATNSPVKILFVGGDFYRKGGDMLLQWARNPNTKCPWEIHIVTRATITDCPKGVHVHNNVQNNSDVIVKMFQDSDIFVLPTKADCLPLVLLEAMASGLPIIASRVAAIPEVVQHNKTGFIFDRDDYSQFSSYLKELIENNSMRLQMANQARKNALEKWSIEVNYSALLNLVKRLGSAYI